MLFAPDSSVRLGACAALAVWACGARSLRHADADAGSVGDGDAGTVEIDAGPPASDAGDPSCFDLVSAFWRDHGGYSTAAFVARFTYEDPELLGVAFVGYLQMGRVTEAEARVISDEATGFGLGGTLLPTFARDTFIFWDPPEDPGGVGAVTAHGAAVFGAGLVADDTGIVLPDSWLDPGLLWEGCPGDVFLVGLDLRDGTELRQQDLRRLLDAISQTPIAAVTRGLDWGTALLYPGTYAPFDPARAEWIIIWEASFPYE